MHTKFKLILSSLLALILLIVAPLGFKADASSLPAKETPIYLKMDKYFILYTRPSAPFLDQQGRLLVPLRSIQDLMGGEVSYSHQTKTATVKLLKQTFELTINAKTAYVNQKELTMDTVPVLKDGALFLPLRLFLDYTDIEYKWRNDVNLLHITDKRVVVGEPFENFAGNDFTAGYLDDAFHLSAFKVQNSSISIKAQNMTGKTVPYGKTDIQPLVQFNTGGFSVDSYTRPGNKKIPEIKIGQSFWVTKNIGIRDPAYIIAVGRKAN
ncbi:copper amine oxidase N-terminal domain-containing protein [Lysinibacillus sp. NPDC056232]|uniref:copper amine oxidase N-terminal domain-containing protein n=1 Tax=Lysinibacillus sp. NPDC056232 TaxID=3345756 RepID=UPI0035E0FD1A